MNNELINAVIETHLELFPKEETISKQRAINIIGNLPYYVIQMFESNDPLFKKNLSFTMSQMNYVKGMVVYENNRQLAIDEGLRIGKIIQKTDVS